MCLLKIDFQNAFNECSRQVILDQIASHFSELFAWTQWCYGCASELQFGPHRILSTSRVQQGDPMGPLLFSLALCHLLDDIGAGPASSDDGPYKLWYLDDGSIIGKRDQVVSLYNQIKLKGPGYGLHLNPTKCELYWPSGDPTFPSFDPSIIRLQDGVSLLGSPIWGSDSFFSSFVAKTMTQINTLQSTILELDDPQVELHILRSCLSVCKVNHLLRTVPPQLLASHLTTFDNNVRTTLSGIIHGPIPDAAWSQATLPFSLGGLGLREATRTAPAAFFASCVAAKPLVSILLPDLPMDDLTLPGELPSRSLLSATLGPDWDINPSQSSLQRALDSISFDCLLADSDIRNTARLKAISTNKTSGWLQAPPLRSIGLDMPNPEFITALKIWLGIPLTLWLTLSSAHAPNSLIDMATTFWDVAKVHTAPDATTPSGTLCTMLLKLTTRTPS